MKRSFIVVGGKKPHEPETNPELKRIFDMLPDSFINELYEKYSKIDGKHKAFKGTKREYCMTVEGLISNFLDSNGLLDNRKVGGGSSDSDSDEARPVTTARRTTKQKKEQKALIKATEEFTRLMAATPVYQVHRDLLESLKNPITRAAASESDSDEDTPRIPKPKTRKAKAKSESESDEDTPRITRPTSKRIIAAPSSKVITAPVAAPKAKRNVKPRGPPKVKVVNADDVPTSMAIFKEAKTKAKAAKGAIRPAFIPSSKTILQMIDSAKDQARIKKADIARIKSNKTITPKEKAAQTKEAEAQLTIFNGMVGTFEDYLQSQSDTFITERLGPMTEGKFLTHPTIQESATKKYYPSAEIKEVPIRIDQIFDNEAIIKKQFSRGVTHGVPNPPANPSHVEIERVKKVITDHYNKYYTTIKDFAGDWAAETSFLVAAAFPNLFEISDEGHEARKAFSNIEMHQQTSKTWTASNEANFRTEAVYIKIILARVDPEYAGMTDAEINFHALQKIFSKELGFAVVDFSTRNGDFELKGNVVGDKTDKANLVVDVEKIAQLILNSFKSTNLKQTEAVKPLTVPRKSSLSFCLYDSDYTINRATGSNLFGIRGIFDWNITQMTTDPEMINYVRALVPNIKEYCEAPTSRKRNLVAKAAGKKVENLVAAYFGQAGRDTGLFKPKQNNKEEKTIYLPVKNQNVQDKLSMLAYDPQVFILQGTPDPKHPLDNSKIKPVAATKENFFRWFQDPLLEDSRKFSGSYELGITELKTLPQHELKAILRPEIRAFDKPLTELLPKEEENLLTIEKQKRIKKSLPNPTLIELYRGYADTFLSSGRTEDDAQPIMPRTSFTKLDNKGKIKILKQLDILDKNYDKQIPLRKKLLNNISIAERFLKKPEGANKNLSDEDLRAKEEELKEEVGTPDDYDADVLKETLRKAALKEFPVFEDTTPVVKDDVSDEEASDEEDSKDPEGELQDTKSADSGSDEGSSSGSGKPKTGKGKPRYTPKPKAYKKKIIKYY